MAKEVKPSLFTDSTGEGMAGATDVPLDVQKNLAETVYTDRRCEGKSCRRKLNPVEALYGKLCPRCASAKAYHQVKNGMV